MRKIRQLFKAKIIILDLSKAEIGHLFIAAKMIEPREASMVDVRLLVKPLTLASHPFRIINRVRVVKELNQFLPGSDIEEVFHVFQIARSLATVNNPPSFSVIVRKILPQNSP